jgi:hypothetical protein
MMYKQFLPQALPLVVAPADKCYDDEWFEAVFIALDHLHDAVSVGQPDSISPVIPADMVGWLQDIVYTAQEAIAEIQAKTPGAGLTEAELLGRKARIE